MKRTTLPLEHLPASLSRFRDLELECTIEVTGGSMEPELPQGSLVVLRGGPRLPPRGAVVAYWAGDRAILHRLVGVDEREGGLWFQARGDANPRPDRWMPVGRLLGTVGVTLRRARRRGSWARLRSLWRGRDASVEGGALTAALERLHAEDGSPAVMERVLRRRADLRFVDLEDELLIRDPDGQRVHVLNRTARELFLMLDGEERVADLAARFGADHGVDARADVAELVRDLLRLEVVEDASRSE
jgi:hypothetical protein